MPSTNDLHTSFSLSVRLFAGLKERAGASALTLAVPAGATVGALKALVRAERPELTPYLEVTRVAVNHEFAPDDQPLGPTDEVALIPPVSGG